MAPSDEIKDRLDAAMQELFVRTAKNILGMNMEFNFRPANEIPGVGNTSRKRSFIVVLF